jgi:hypothetical protein
MSGLSPRPSPAGIVRGMPSCDPTIIFDATEHTPPANRPLFVYEVEQGWWVGQYFPDEEIDEYQPHAWHLAGFELPMEWRVTHWMFLPPAP